jgi:hypothetical protein
MPLPLQKNANPITKINSYQTHRFRTTEASSLALQARRSLYLLAVVVERQVLFFAFFKDY